MNVVVLKVVTDDLEITPRNAGRVTKAQYVDSLICWRQRHPYFSDTTENQQPDRIVTTEVMDRIAQVIEELDAPSWLGSVPKNFGQASAGTLKADQWRTLFTVHLPLALISLWGEGTKHRSTFEASRPRDNLDHFMKLVNCILLSFSRKINPRRAEEYRTNIKDYIANLPGLYPHVTARPNHHIAFHVYDFMNLFGPAHSW